MENLWALVTGASSGIGFAYAKELASRGYPVVMVSNEKQAIQEKGEWIRQTYGVDVLALYQDLAMPGAAKALFETCQAEGIIVDILVNNAGMFFLNEIVDEKEKFLFHEAFLLIYPVSIQPAGVQSTVSSLRGDSLI